MVLRLHTTLPGPHAEFSPQNGDSRPFPSQPSWDQKLVRAIHNGLNELSDPAFLGPMLVAQGVFGFSRLALLKFLPQGLSKGGALVAANLGAFGLEGVSFVGSTRGIQHLMGHPALPEADFSKELGHAYLTLGLLKGLGGITQSALALRYQKIPASQLVWQDQLLLKGAPQAASFGGIYLSHTLAPHFGLGEYMDPSDRLVQSAVSLIHFGAAGILMSRIPGYAAANQRIHRETQGLIQERWNALNFGSVAITPEGMEWPVPPTQDAGSTQIMQINASEGINGSRKSPSPSPDSIPPQSGIRRGSSPTPKLTESNLGIRIPDRGPSIGTIPTIEPAPTIRSSREGVRRAQAQGLDQNALAFLRMAGNELRNFPELRRSFFEHVRNILKFMETRQAGLDSVLKEMPERDFTELNQKREEFDEALARLAPESGKNLAEAILFLEGTKDLTTAESYRDLTDAHLVGLGLEPMARYAFSRNAHAFSSQEMAYLLEHPLLKDLPETEKLLQAYQTFDKSVEKFLPTLEKITAEIKKINEQLKKTTSAQEQFRLEALRETTAGKIGSPYWKMVTKLNNQMENFIEDRARANILHIRIAREAHITRAIQDAHPRVLADYLEKNSAELTERGRAAHKKYLRAYYSHKIFNAPGFGHLLKGLAAFQPFNLPALTRGALDRATLDLITEIPSGFWRFETSQKPYLQEAQAAGERFFRSQNEMAQNLREKTSPLDEKNDQYWEGHDKEVEVLNAADIRLQVQQAQTYIELAREAMPQAAFEKHFAKRYAEGLKMTQEAIEVYEKTVETGQHARRINRSEEVAVERNKKYLTDLAREALRRARKYSHKPLPDPQFRCLSALLMPYVEKINSHWYTRFGENLDIIFTHALPTLGQSLRLFKRIGMRESTEQIDGIFLQYSRSRTVVGGSRLVVDPQSARESAAEPFVQDGKHDAWDDFLRGGTPLARAAQLQNGKQNHNHRDSPRIGAKAGLGKKVPLAGKAIDLLTVSISDSAIEYDGAVTYMARAMAFGDRPAKRLGPRSSAVYSELTMPVSSIIGPYVWDPFPSLSTIMAPPVGGRSYTIGDRAMALTGRAQNLLLTTTLNSYRLWPKPDFPLPLREGPLTTTTELWPMMALTEVTDSILRFQRPSKPSRANWLRTLWLREASKPEYQLPVPSVERIFDPFRKPIDPELEQQIATMFEGAAEVYPSVETIRTIDGELSNVKKQIGALEKSEQEVPEPIRFEEQYLTQALDQKTRQLLGIRLTVLDQKLTQELKDHSHIPETKELRRRHRMIQARIHILEEVERKASTGEPLSLTETKFLEKAQAYYAGKTTVEARDPLMDQVEYYFTKRYPDGDLSQPKQAHASADRILGTMKTVIDHVKISGWQHKEEILKILESRQQKLVQAFTRNNLGEPLTPVDQILIEDMAGIVSREDSPKHQDHLVSAIMQNHIQPERLEKVLKAERVREAQRALIEKLPGGGRGTIDPIRESADDAAKVMLNAAGEVTAGPRSLAATYSFLGKFSFYPAALGVLGGLDLLNHRKTDYYTWASPFIARHAMRSVNWRPVLSAEDVRVLEDIQIEAAESGRPIALGDNHASWTDITTVMAVYPKMRFAYKTELLKIPGLNWALKLGDHIGIDRPENQALKGFIKIPQLKIFGFKFPKLKWGFWSGPFDQLNRFKIKTENLQRNTIFSVKIPFIKSSATEGDIKYFWFGEQGEIEFFKEPTREEREKAFDQVQAAGKKMVETGLAPNFFHSGTRSLTGVPGAPKDGIAHLVMPTNALILGLSIVGTRQILGDGPKAFKDGMGTNRRIYIGARRIDPRELVDLDAVMAKPDSIKGMVRAGKKISEKLHEEISDRFLRQLDHLREQAQKGDAMAQAQLAEQMAAIEEGMDLIREGRDRKIISGETGEVLEKSDFAPAKAWAKANKTDYPLLTRITEWWDASANTGE